MIQLKCKSTNQFIEVNEIDAHWYAGHDDYEAIKDAETAETIETEPQQEEKREVLKRGRPKKQR